MVEYQLRIYRIKPGTLDEFYTNWRRDIVPIREKFGFKVVSAWTNEQKSEFVWLVSYDGPEGYVARDAEYYNSPERNTMSWDPHSYVEHMELRLLQGLPTHN
ncbi:MAG TPA: NIPSNAP family protein [Dictyobacter sp.]|jgi:hypothetical protein|nr:NIPSNAP family protein [Dictyobacter sp.]